MAKRNEAIEGPHWHFDCRIEGELPENRVVGLRFLLTTACALAAAVTFLLSSWLLYRDFTLRYQIKDWFQRIEDARSQMTDIDQMQAEYATETAKIDSAYAVMKRPFVVSTFLADFGAIVPEGLEINVIDATDSGMKITGTMHASTEVASDTLGSFVKRLNRDEHYTKIYSAIRLTQLERDESNVIAFTINFVAK